jgi:hypothetical protein
LPIETTFASGTPRARVKSAAIDRTDGVGFWFVDICNNLLSQVEIMVVFRVLAGLLALTKSILVGFLVPTVDS